MIDEAAGRDGSRLRPWLRPTVVAPVLVAAVFLVTGFVHLLTTWEPYGDWAVAELIVRHTGRYLPLSGPYSAARGYNHPLPLVYALQWLPYHLFGEWRRENLLFY